jgi:hypothetical protein
LGPNQRRRLAVDIETALVLLLLFGAVMMLGTLWTLHRATLLPSDIPSHLDPILGKPDRVAIHDTYGPYIPMPGDLRTKDEMLEWLIKELPKLTAEGTKTRS